MHVATLIYLLVVQHTAVVWSLEVFWQNFLTLIIALMTTDQWGWEDTGSGRGVPEQVFCIPHMPKSCPQHQHTQVRQCLIQSQVWTSVLKWRRGKWLLDYKLDIKVCPDSVLSLRLHIAQPVSIQFSLRKIDQYIGIKFCLVPLDSANLSIKLSSTPLH